MSRPILKSPRTSGIAPKHLPADRKVHLSKSEPVFGRHGKVGSSSALEQSDKTVTFSEKVNMRVFQKEDSVPLNKKFESLMKMLMDGSMDVCLFQLLVSNTLDLSETCDIAALS